MGKKLLCLHQLTPRLLATAIKTGGKMPPNEAVRRPSIHHPWRLGFLSGRALLNAVSRPWVGRLFHTPLSAWAQPCCWRVAPQQSPFPRPAALQKYKKIRKKGFCIIILYALVAQSTRNKVTESRKSTISFPFYQKMCSIVKYDL